MTTSHFARVMGRAYAHREDCFIEPLNDGSSILRDADGEKVWEFSEEWTDEQIWAALEFANSCYRNGVLHGERAKAHEVRRALEID